MTRTGFLHSTVSFPFVDYAFTLSRLADLCAVLLQKNGVALPMFEDEAVKRPLQQHADRWRFWCIFENGKKFPKAGFGHDIGEEPPSFTSKKARTDPDPACCWLANNDQRAKNFTAMQVIKYLRSEPRLAGSLQTDITLGSGGRGLPSLSTLSSAAKRVKRESQSPSPSTNHNLPTTANIPNNDSMSKTVAETAVSLGMEAPRIEVTPDENLKDGFYKGCAVWNLGARVPEGLGSVRGILGSKECKAQVEQTLLKWMQEEVHRRGSVAQSLLSRTA